MKQPYGNRAFLVAFSLTMVVLSLGALWLGRGQLAFVALSTLALAYVPVLVASRLQISLPVPFLVATGAFVFASIFMGEAFDFYERFWWWDLALHGSSAIGFGLIGFLFVFMLFEGDRYAAPPWAVGFIATCLAITVGTLWEIFEFATDSFLGTNMLKSGFDDIMGDLIVNTIGSVVGGFSGSLYLIGARSVIFVRLIDQFVELNLRIYRKSRDRFRK